MDARPLLRTSALMLCLGALAYFGYGSLETDESQDTVNSAAPDYIADGINGWSTNINGERLRTLHAERLEHYPTPERFTLKRPVLRFIDNDKNPWVASSLTASGTNPNTDTWLEQQVQVTRTTGEGTLTMDTSRLHINAREHLLQTPELVVLSSQQNNMQGLGMKADLSQNSVELLSSVEVTYAPSR